MSGFAGLKPALGVLRTTRPEGRIIRAFQRESRSAEPGASVPEHARICSMVNAFDAD
jgi:hypothetical protein